MNGIHDRKFHDDEKPFPGCLGRMVNLFDLTAGVTGNRLLTDKPFHDASPLSRSQSDVARIRSPFADQMEDKQIVCDLWRSSSKKKINGTPIKMLIDQEMSKEVDSKHSPPNVVAKLMGLETLPWEEPNRSQRKDYSHHMSGHSGIPFNHWQPGDRFMDKEMLCEVHQSAEKIDYNDIYQLRQQSQRTSHVRDKTPEIGRWTEDANGKKMALIRQKFMEAKRLSTDERLRQSKEFEDALEVLSSNKDLFLRFLDSQNLYELQSTPQPDTKRITVLKPSKMLHNEKFAVKEKNDRQIKKPANVGQAAVWGIKNHGFSPTTQKVDDYQVQHTRIVVLKPSSGKTHEIKAVVSPTSSPRCLPSGNVYQGPQDGDEAESRKMTKEIKHQMHDDLSGHQRDETLYSSVFSNGYTGDESSFNRSENDYAAGNFSDLEVMSPSPRHSWDYVNRYSTPYSPSCLSRASCSPESSVCREAKKRLSERWAMIALNKGPQEQRGRRSSSLGEMLALSDTKKPVSSEIEGINKEQKLRESIPCSSNTTEEIQVDGSPKNLPRSKSVPVSSTVYDMGLSIEICDPEAGKVHGSKELAKSKGMKSFKGKVTSLFFSRNKKLAKENSSLSICKDESQSTVSETSASLVNSPRILGDNLSQSISNGGGFGECSVPAQLSSKTLSDSLSKGQGIITLERELTVSKPMMPGTSGENQDQPSPISVLEPSFRDDNAAQESLDCIKAGHLGMPLKSNLIDKSPPIESISRTLSWEDSLADVASPYPLKSLTVSLDTKVEDQDWLVFVQKLLSAAGLDDQMQSDSFHSRWHSPESPLNPSLRDKYAYLDDKEQPLHEAKRRQRRSNQKLIFDCVNSAIKEITGYESEIYFMGRICSKRHSNLPENASPLLVDLIVTQMKELICSGVSCVWGNCGDSNSLVVEGMVRKEVVGKGWNELMEMETAYLGREIEGKLLEELVEEAVVDLTGRTLTLL